MKKKFSILFTLSLITVILITSCKKDDGEDEPENKSPIASFIITPTAGNTSTNFEFDGSPSNDPDSETLGLQYRWDFDNDGTWDEQYSADPIAFHTYTTEGTYTVKLEVKDNEGATGSTTKDVTVSNSGNLPPGAPSNPNPADQATEQPLTIMLGWTCDDPNQDPLTYDINFGTTNPPPSAATGLTANAYDPGNLQANTTYYWQVIAKDNQGESTTGSIWQFTTGVAFQCGLDFTDPRDGIVYPTIQMGAACWMKANLNHGSMISGATESGDNGTIEKYCYNDDINNCTTYGGLYQWDEMMHYNAGNDICPQGWHVATLDDWKNLEIHLGMDPGQAANTNPGWYGTDQGAQLMQAAGFNALLGGYRGNSGNFAGEPYITRFWTGNESSATAAQMRELNFGNDQVFHGQWSKEYGYSVRCVRD